MAYNHTIRKSVSASVEDSGLQRYLERLRACLANIWRYQSDDVIQRYAAEACDIVRSAVNLCSFTGLHALLDDLKKLRIEVNTAFVLTSCLTHSPLAQGKALTKKWAVYFAPYLLEDEDFRSTLAQANSKQFKRAIELSGNYTSKKVRPKRERDDVPKVVQAVVDAVLDDGAGDEDANMTITNTGAGVDHTNPSFPADMTLYGTCRTCDMVAFGELDTQMAFYCQQCWEQHYLLLQRTNGGKTT